MESRTLGENETCGFHTQIQQNVKDVPTEFVYQAFDNKWFLFISQYRKMANLFEVDFDIAPSGGSDLLANVLQRPINDPERHQSVPINIKCVFGVDDLHVRGAISFLINQTKLNRCPTQILLSLGLKEINGVVLREIVQILEKIIT